MEEDIKKALEREKKAIKRVTVCLFIALAMLIAFYIFPFFLDASEFFWGKRYSLVPFLILAVGFINVLSFSLWVRHWEKRLNATR